MGDGATGAVMFTVEFAKGACLGYARATAKAATLRRAIDFVSAFAPGGCGVIVSEWAERDGRRVLEVYDWCECWCADPPVLARIFATPDRSPT